MAAVAVRNAMGMLLVNAGDADGAGDDACAKNGALTTGHAAGAASALVRPNREKKPPRRRPLDAGVYLWLRNSIGCAGSPQRSTAPVQGTPTPPPRIGATFTVDCGCSMGLPACHVKWPLAAAFDWKGKTNGQSK